MGSILCVHQREQETAMNTHHATASDAGTGGDPGTVARAYPRSLWQVLTRLSSGVRGALEYCRRYREPAWSTRSGRTIHAMQVLFGMCRMPVLTSRPQ